MLFLSFHKPVHIPSSLPRIWFYHGRTFLPISSMPTMILCMIWSAYFSIVRISWKEIVNLLPENFDWVHKVNSIQLFSEFINHLTLRRLRFRHFFVFKFKIQDTFGNIFVVIFHRSLPSHLRNMVNVLFWFFLSLCSTFVSFVGVIVVAWRIRNLMFIIFSFSVGL